MKTYEQVDAYMQEIGLKYIKNSNEFIAGLAVKTDRAYAKKVAEELNARAKREHSSNSVFYKIKNESLAGSVYISAAFDGGLFRHLGNLIIDNPQCFETSVIDMGCDCGIVTCFIAKMYPQCRVTGIDVNADAIRNANELAQNLGLDNVKFVCADVFEYVSDEKADTVTSFRGLLDICMGSTKDLPFFGERCQRENLYKEAFAGYAKAIGDNLNDLGNVISVERYTADYGWMGWMLSLEQQGIYTDKDKCAEMRASDISSVKDYSVTFAKKENNGADALDTLTYVLEKSFKSGTGYDGYMAEFALYYDADGAIKFYDVYKGEKIIHQFAFANSKSDKIMYYDANGNKKKIKYANKKKQEALDKDLQDRLALYDENEYEIKEYELN